MTSVSNPDAIRLLQMRAQLGALKLEARGMKRKGRSMSAMLKDHWGIPQSTSRAKVQERLEALIEEAEKAYIAKVNGEPKQ